ncbi:MFS transporter [Histidinibacterium aquaticum]|uniref:MFS transporter n=1 Tax=Histidinibacterium aquaticum TaxID=2613962 RepID=UPI00168BEEC2|nr:MFS transporter [Histidinibacterium aquaticum]
MRLEVLRRNRGFGRLIAGQIPSDAADWLAYVAMTTLLAFEWQAPTVAFAWFAVALGAPYLTVGLVAGALVDRLPLKAVLVGSNLARALVFAAMTLAQDWVTLLVLLAVGQSVDSFFSPAKQAALQGLVRREDRMGANGISYAINQTSKIAAPAAGGALLAVLEPGAVFWVTAAVSLLAVPPLLALPGLERKAPKGDATLGIARDVAEGLRIVGRSVPLRLALGLTAAGFFSIFLYDTLIAPLLRDIGFDEVVMGWTMAAVGGGGVLGALLMTRLTAQPFRLIAFGAIGSGLLLMAPALAELTGRGIDLAVLLGVFVLAGITSSAMLVPPRVVIQNETDESAIARVSSVMEAANMLALLTAPFVGAWLAGAISSGAAFVAGAALKLVLGVVALRAAMRLGGGQTAEG